MFTDVYNLLTWQVKTYSLPPVKAVIAAWRQEQGDWSTWEYEKFTSEVRSGERTVCCGDWCAWKDKED